MARVFNKMYIVFGGVEVIDTLSGITEALRKEFIRRENKKIVKDLEVLG